MPDKHPEVALSFLKEGGTNFPKRPKLAEDLLIFQMPDGLGMQFRGLSNPVVLRGALAETLLPKLMPLLDGKNEVSELIEKLAPEASAGDVADLLKNLFTRGAIADAEEVRMENAVDRKNQLFFGRRLGVTRNNGCASEVLEKLARSPIVVIADGLLGSSVLDLLIRSGFRNLAVAALRTDASAQELFSGFPEEIQIDYIDGSEDAVEGFMQSRINSAELVVAALRSVPQSVFASINELCVQAQVQWLRAHDNGSNIEVGPYVNPHDSPCFECMLVRQISGGDYAVEEELFQNFLEEQSSVHQLSGESIGLATQAAAYLAQESVRIVSAIEKPCLDGGVVTFHSDGNIEQNWFIRVPRCAVCARGGAIILPERTHASKVS